MAIKPGTEILVNKKGSSGFKEGDEISPISSSKSNLQNQQQNAVKTASRYQAMTVHEKRLQKDEEKLRKKQVPTEHEIILASAKSKKKSGETLTKKENIVLGIEKSKLTLDTQTLKVLSDQADKDYNTAKINEFKGADSSASYSALAKKNTLNTAYKNSLMADTVNTATGSLDFNSKSVADETVADNEYKYINDINGFRNSSKSAYDKATTLHANSADTAATAAVVKFVSQSTKPSYMDSNYEYMTDEEIKVYNYYFNKGQKSRAKEYLSMLKDTLQQRANGEIEKNMTDLAKTSKAGASVLSVATNVGSALQQGINTIKYLGTGVMDANDYALMTSSLRKGVTDQVDWTIGNWDAFDFIYNTGMSGVDSLIMAPAGSAGAVMLGLSAAASTSNDVLERGGTSSQAFWSGLMAGAAETVFEKISIGQLNVMKDTAVESVLDVVKNYGKAMLTNASEEALTEIANIGTDYLINGGISQYSLLVSEYIANGETTASAKRKASQQMVNQVLEAGASGAFMGLGFATLGTGISYARDTATYNATGKAIVANGQENFIIKKALELNPKSVAYKLANEIQSSGKLNNQKLGKLSFEIKSEINNSINKKITAAVNTQIEATDITADEKYELSIAFEKAISGEELSPLENKILSNSEVASQVSSDLDSRTAPWVKSLDTQLEQNRSDFNLINSAMNLSLEKLSKISNDLQHNGNSDIISTAGESNGIFEKRTVGQTSGYNGGRTQSVERGRQEILSNDSARAQGVAASTGQRHTVNYKNSSVNYIEAASDKNDGYKAYLAFRSAGIKAIYCDGDIIRNVNGVDIVRTEAFTAPDGTVYISNKSTLPAKEIYDHERVHVADFINEKAYSDYEDIVCNNLDYESDSYAQRAKQLNEGQFGGKYDIFNPDNARYFIKEFCAYINQYVLSDPSYAQELFGGMFRDWSAVTAAVEKFNKDMGADFSESAFSMPSDTSSAQSGSNLTQEQKNLNAVLSAATSGMKRSYPLNNAKNSAIIKESSNGGADNGREGLLRDGSQWARGEGPNSEIQIGGVPQDYGGISGVAEEVAQNNGDRPALRNQGDNRRLSPSEEQALEGTIVANEDGTPKAVYHFTDNMDFDTFGEGDIGFHFGNEAQSLKRAADLKQTGRTIKAFLAIKNPIRIPMDIMGWRASQTALRLLSYDIITEEQDATIRALQLESGGTYNTPAARELRRILTDKGYDGIVYDNHHEGDGESYIAFYPEQVIILDDGKGNTQATSDTEVASFVPENEQGEAFESGEENNTPETQNPVSEEFEEDFEEENGSFFDEPSAEFPKPNLIEDIGAKAAGVTRYSDGQRLIMRIGKNLGYKVVFDPELKTKMGATSNGKIDFDNKIIYLNPAVSKPLQFIFGHEITHFGTASETFEEFIEPIRKTNLYLKWLQRKTGSDSSSVGLLEGLYRERVMESRKNADPMGAAEAQEEMYADFCGETFFSDGERGLTRLLNSLEGKKRSKVMQFIHDFVSYLKEKLSGNKDITLQLIRLESKFADVLKSAKENTAENSGVKYSVSKQSVIDLSDDNELSKQIGNLRGAPKYKIIQNYILKVLENQPIMLSDGKSAIVDRSDALHIANKSGNVKTAQISKIKELVESAKLYAEDTEVEHNKFNYFCYYKADVKFGKETFPIFLNVGRGINDNKYHIYDITKKIRDTAHRINGVERPKPNEGYALENGISSDITVPQKAQSVNSHSMQKNEKYSISLDERAENDTETDSDIGDIPSAMEELMQQYQNGDFGEDIFRARMDEIYNEALNRFGVIPEGENAETPISVPQKISEDKITRRFVRTILETGKLTSDMIADVEGEILLGDMMSYEEVSNETAMKRADRSFERGTAEADWQKVISGGVISETDIAIGEKLLLKAIEDNDRLKVLDLSSELSDIFTRSGRVVQAARMLKKMSGVGRLMTAQRNVTAINQSLTEKYGDRKDVPQVKLNPTLARQLAETQSFEDTEVVYQNVLQDIAAQVPATFMDKLNAWRYFAMLANPRTHIRNLVSNTIFTPSVMIKNLLATGAEHLFVRDKSKRTKAVFIKKEYLEFAKKDIKSREAKAMLEGKGQLDDKGMIQELRRTFDSDFLENLTKGNSNLLEKEDMWFKSVHYRNALAGFLQARKVDLNNIGETTLMQAREYAVKEAKKATFQDASVLADLLNNIKTPKNWRGNSKAEAAVLAARIGVEGTLPFKRTPINIVKRGIEYSPLGLTETLTVGLIQVRKGEISVSEFCDGLASGITGSALMAIGYFLAAAGFAVGGFGDDEEDKFRQLNGEQEYSVQIFGKSYTVDWAAPAAIPFFIGVELADEIKNGDGFQWRDLGDIAWNTLEPITNLSMLSGLQGLIETVKYVDSSQTIGAMVGDIGISFGMQLVPSFFGGISRTIDSTQRTWYNDKNSQLGNTAQTIKNNMQAKIPGLSFTQAPSIDAWGREKKRGSVGERIAENFISPGYYSEIDYDSADTELMRLAKATGEGVFPKQAEKSFSVGGETKYLTADEWVTFAKAKGEYSFDYIHEFIESDSYEKLTDEQRVKVMDNLYEYAKAKAKTTVSQYDLMKSYKSVTNFERNGGSAVTYYVRRAVLN